MRTFRTGLRGGFVLSAIVASSLGCMGAIGDDEQAPGAEPSATTPGRPGAPTGTATGGGATGGGGTATDPSMPTSLVNPASPASALPPERMTSTLCKGIDPGPAVVRRLTRKEYNNTVRDLLGDTTQPGKDFPTEERVEGFDNNAAALSISPVLAEQYLLAADRLATGAVDKNLAVLVGCDPTKLDDACAAQFFQSFGRRAFRRPPLPEELTLLRDVYNAGKANGGFRNGIRLAVMEMLMSPPFLYRIEFGVKPQTGETVVRLDPYETANRLSYLLWNSMPDEPLFQAARDNKLVTAMDIKTQVTRMLADAKAREVTRHFTEQWLDLDRMDGMAKDAKAFPTFNAGILSGMEQEVVGFVDQVIWKDEAGTLGALLTAPYTFVNTTMARFYGLTPPTGTSYTRTAVDGQKRAGLLTQGAIMAAYSHGNQTSPVLRGKFVREQLLCQRPPDPPNNVVVEVPKLDTRLTTRERFVRHSTDPACAGCHALMDPIGLGFENFDPVGLWRDSENGRAIDASGEVRGMATAAWDGKFNGVVDLGKKLAAADEVGGCLTTKFFQYGYGRTQTDSDACSMDVLRKRFATGGHKLRDLVAALTETDAFLYRRVVTPGGAQ